MPVVSETVIAPLTRRAACVSVGLLLAVPVPAPAQRAASRHHLALYAATGVELTRYEVDVEQATLTKNAAVTLPGAIQYAWPHPARNYLYAAWSNVRERSFGVTTVQAANGRLEVIGSAPLTARPIHITVDPSGTHVLLAYNSPSLLTVHPILADRTVGMRIEQKGPLDFGIYAHQARVDPSGKTLILVARGNGPEGDRPEDPGALRVFRYKDGTLRNLSVTAPRNGVNFQPRHLDFHSSRQWVYVSLERQNKLHVYLRKPDGSLGPEPLFVQETLADAAHPEGQLAGAVHMHPGGRFLYQANRATGTREVDGKRVFAGGENSIAVSSINPATGEPVRIQNADTRGISPRTFCLDPQGRLLVAANQMPMMVSGGDGWKQVPPSLAIFRVQQDGKLEFVRKVDTATGPFWVGMVPWI